MPKKKRRHGASTMPPFFLGGTMEPDSGNKVNLEWCYTSACIVIGNFDGK